MSEPTICPGYSLLSLSQITFGRGKPVAVHFNDLESPSFAVMFES